MASDVENRSIPFFAVDQIVLVAVVFSKEEFFDEALLRIDVLVERPFLLIDKGFSIDSAGMARIGEQENLVVVEQRADGNGQILNIGRKVLQFELLPEETFDVSMFANVDLLVFARDLRTVSQGLFQISQGVLDEQLRMPVEIGVFDQRDGLAVDQALIFLGGEIRTELIEFDRPARFDRSRGLILLVQSVDLADAKKHQPNEDFVRRADRRRIEEFFGGLLKD